MKKHWEWLYAKIVPTLSIQNSQSNDMSALSFLDQFHLLHKYDFDSYKAYAAKLPDFVVKLMSVRFFL